MENLNANCGIWLFAIGIRLPAHGAGLPTSKSQRACVWPMLRIPPCLFPRAAWKPPHPPPIPSAECITNCVAGRWPKYRAQRSAHRLQKRTIKCASPETVSRNGQSLPRQMRSCLVLPWNRPSRVPRASCLVPRAPLLRRKWPLVSVLINAGMKLRRHHLRRTEGRTGAGGGGEGAGGRSVGGIRRPILRHSLPTDRHAVSR